jgi:hypothetical protein
MYEGDTLGVDKFGHLAIQHADGSIDVLTDGQGVATPDALGTRAFSDTDGGVTSAVTAPETVTTPAPVAETVATQTPAEPAVVPPTEAAPVQAPVSTPEVVPGAEVVAPQLELRALIDSWFGSVAGLQTYVSDFGNPTVLEVLSWDASSGMERGISPMTYASMQNVHKFLEYAMDKGLLPQPNVGEKILDYLVRIGISY